jgi:hypothetical protein
MPIAYKEWAITVRALAEGEQLLTLRRGADESELEHDRFFLYPTFDHQVNDLVREAHHPELGRALEEGVWRQIEISCETAASLSPTECASGRGQRFLTGSGSTTPR